MLGFLANVIEQLDVALEHLTKCDANNAPQWCGSHTYKE
jgi:hypothetical protein